MTKAKIEEAAWECLVGLLTVADHGVRLRAAELILSHMAVRGNLEHARAADLADKMLRTPPEPAMPPEEPV